MAAIILLRSDCKFRALRSSGSSGEVKMGLETAREGELNSASIISAVYGAINFKHFFAERD